MKSFYPSGNEFCNEIEIKRSRFITFIAHTPDPTSAQRFIATIQTRHPKANHNCWAHIAGDRTDSNCWHSSDDGEPKGTAGKPMLNVLEHSNLCEITVVVTRYFGGIKLGAGGLVRAYSQAVQDALNLLPVTEKIPLIAFSIGLPHTLINRIEATLLQSQVSVHTRDWQAEQLAIEGNASAEQLEVLHTLLGPIMHQISYFDARMLR